MCIQQIPGPAPGVANCAGETVASQLPGAMSCVGRFWLAGLEPSNPSPLGGLEQGPQRGTSSCESGGSETERGSNLEDTRASLPTGVGGG